jgi:hypothetical protein
MADQSVLVDHLGMTSSPSAMATQTTNQEADPEALIAQALRAAWWAGVMQRPHQPHLSPLNMPPLSAFEHE